MLGRRNQGQRQLFYEFRLDEAVPDDHLVRQIASFVDLSWVYGELAPYYSALGRPSIDPVLMIRMLILGYVLRSGRSGSSVARFRSTWPIDGSVIWASRTASPITQRSRVPATSGSGRAISSDASSSAS